MADQIILKMIFEMMKMFKSLMILQALPKYILQGIYKITYIRHKRFHLFHKILILLIHYKKILMLNQSLLQDPLLYYYFRLFNNKIHKTYVFICL